MSELEDLPSWAGRLTREVDVPRQPDEAPDTDVADDPAQAEEPAHDAATAAEAPTADAEPAAPEAPSLPTERPGLAPRVASEPTPDGPPVAEEPPQPPRPPALPVTPLPEDQEATRPFGGPASTDLPSSAPIEATDLPPSAPIEVADLPLSDPIERAETTVATLPAAAHTPPRRRRSLLRTLLMALVGLAVLAAAGYGGYLLANLNDSEETAAAGTDDQAAADTTDGAEATDDATADGEDDGTDGSAAVATDGETGTDGAEAADDATAADESADPQTVTVDVDGAEDAAEDGTADGAMNDGDRQAFFRGGKVYLTGAVPSEEVAELIVQKAAAVVGPDNVVNEYVIDPTTTINPGDSAPLFVEDVILFEFNSVAIAQPFLPILDLGVLLLSQNPQASITVVTRTDAVGSSEINMQVAEQRADAVIRYWLSKGVDRDQIKADPRGEEGASEDDDPETAARQRRAEFIITGLLD